MNLGGNHRWVPRYPTFALKFPKRKQLMEDTAGVVKVVYFNALVNFQNYWL